MLKKNKSIIKFLLVILMFGILFASINLDYSLNNRNYLNRFNKKSKFEIKFLYHDKDFGYYQLVDSCYLLPGDYWPPKFGGSSGYNNFKDYNTSEFDYSYPENFRNPEGALLVNFKVVKNKEIIIKLACGYYIMPVFSDVFLIKDDKINF